jgi:MFS family permease
MSVLRLGIRENLPQFSLLVVVNAFVGAMVGMERSILPAIGEQEFHLAARTAVLSFIVVFGVTKALTNYFAGRLSDRFGRKHVLVAGWLVAVPVPFLLMWAPSWNWILFANVLLGVSQGLTWSATVIMKIDLAGAKNRGLAMGLNEFAGYCAVAGSALATGWIAVRYGLRPEPFYLGIGFVALGLGLSTFVVRESKHHVAQESKLHGEMPPEGHPTQREVFWRTSLLDRNLSSVSQAGLVNNVNDGMAWGLFPLFFAAAQMTIGQIGTLAAIYPATWGVAQLFTGAWSDGVGRKWLIAAGMWVQAAGIAVVIVSGGFGGFAVGATLLGIGTAMVYPTLLAAIGDVAHPSWRASSVGVYRLWRDLGYAIGALLAGVTADALGLPAAMWIIAAITFGSGIVVALRMTETLRRRPPFGPEPTVAERSQERRSAQCWRPPGELLRREDKVLTRHMNRWGTLVLAATLLAGSHTARAQSDAEPMQPSLYDRLGGLAPISVVVSDFIDAVVGDAVLNANAEIDAARKRVPAPYLKYHVTAMVCQATGGPCQYHGRGMKESHVHLNITEPEWDRMVTLFKEVLLKHKVPAKETQELLDIVGSTKADIVVSRPK